MVRVIAVEATFTGLRAARIDAAELVRVRVGGLPRLEAFEAELWSAGNTLSSFGEVAKSGMLLPRVIAIIQKVAKDCEQDIAGVGVTVSAAVHRNGVVHLTHEVVQRAQEDSNRKEYIQIPLLVPLQDQLTQLWNHPVEVAVENRSNMGAWGEYHLGQGVVMRSTSLDPRDTIYITVSGNIGVGIIADGHLYTGFKGYAGEMGHLVVDATSDRVCPACGKRGCASELASGRALIHDVEKSIGEGGSVACLTSVVTATPAADAARYDAGYVGIVQEGRNSHRIDARSVLLASQSGTCTIANRAVDNLVKNLAKLVEEITYIFDPHLVVLGAIASCLPNLQDRVVELIDLPPFERGGRELLTAHLEDRSALMGVGLWVYDQLRRQMPNDGAGSRGSD